MSPKAPEPTTEEPVQEQPIAVTEEVVEEQPAVPAVVESPPQPEEQEVEFVPHGKVDPTFNCADCIGEGMIFFDIRPEGVICSTCKGTGKV